ncbi:hypothetical protein NOR53_1093 [gamma proteobacterium NOR5-3]|nr:hypothetical protein NOR53_1093 [gamma proteobacterium NOR5-3]
MLFVILIYFRDCNMTWPHENNQIYSKPATGTLQSNHVQ